MDEAKVIIGNLLALVAQGSFTMKGTDVTTVNRVIGEAQEFLSREQEEEKDDA